jgi:Mn-dependent DtxR family transcriptional regulator
MPIKDLEKLRKKTLRERIYEEVVRLIVSGELPSGGWVDEKQVTDKLRVSRTPFREAIGILAKGGLVEIKPYRGFYVRSFSRNETADLYELYKRLECFAVELAVPQMTTATSGGLKIYLLKPWSPCSAETLEPMLCAIGNFTKISPSNPEIPHSSRRWRGLRCKSSSVAQSQM